MGSCCSCVGANQIVPLEEKQPKKVKDNFVHRERGDGESERDSDADKSKNHSLNLDRHISGSSFSSKSCDSRSIDELEEDEDLLAYLNTNHHGREVISRYDMMSEVTSEVKTEGGLTDVALEMDHPFAPLYESEDELNEATLSRPRSVGQRGRSSYTRDLLSQMSNCSELDSLGDHPSREDTPVPGKRGGSNMSVLSKRKKKRSKRGLAPTHPLAREDSDLHNITPRSIGSTPGSFSIGSSFTVRTDDGGSSLNSSSSSLSAIGEISEGGSASTVERSARPLDPGPIKQPRIQKEISNKENFPPIPTPRVTKRNPNAPKSADILGSEKEVELNTQAPRSAETLLGGRQETTVNRKFSRKLTDEHRSKKISDLFANSPESYPNAWRNEDSLRTSTPAMANGYPKEGSSLDLWLKPKPADRQLPMSKLRGSEDKLKMSNNKPDIAEKPKLLPKPAMRNFNNRDSNSKTSLGNYKALDRSNTNQLSKSDNNRLKSPLNNDRLNRNNREWVNPTTLFEEKPYTLSRPKPTSAVQHHSREEAFNIVQDRPMAARPRRPATAAESMVSGKLPKQKLPHMISETLSSEDSMDDESHPDPPNNQDRFRTIIII